MVYSSVNTFEIHLGKTSGMMNNDVLVLVSLILFHPRFLYLKMLECCRRLLMKSTKSGLISYGQICQPNAVTLMNLTWIDAFGDSGDKFLGHHLRDKMRFFLPQGNKSLDENGKKPGPNEWEISEKVTEKGAARLLELVQNRLPFLTNQQLWNEAIITSKDHVNIAQFFPDLDARERHDERVAKVKHVVHSVSCMWYSRVSPFVVFCSLYWAGLTIHSVVPFL